MRLLSWKTPSLLHLTMLLCIGALSFLLLRSIDTPPAQTLSTTASTSAPALGAVQNNDDAVKAYLDVAQKVAGIYHYVNGSYDGMCEPIKNNQYTLEDGMAALRYIKMVGATEVFCMTSDDLYMIEAQMPESKLFYCVDSTDAARTLGVTSEGGEKCQE